MENKTEVKTNFKESDEIRLVVKYKYSTATQKIKFIIMTGIVRT
jgi:hypothetical protein